MIDPESIKEGEGIPKDQEFDIHGTEKTSGQKLDDAINSVDEATERVKNSFNQLREEGWEGMKKRTMDYARSEPLNALLIAVAAGFVLGWILKRGTR